MDLDSHRYRLRTDLVGAAYDAFAAAGVRPPSPVERIGPAPPVEEVKSGEDM